MADSRKICPHCGSEQFMAFIKRGGIVQSDVDKDGNSIFKVVKEGAKDNYEIELFKCVKCNAQITAEDLITSARCKKCGKPVNPADLNKNGVCSVCAMLDEDPSLGEASTEDLLRLLAEARKNANPVKSKIESKEEKAAKVEKKATAATAQTTDINDIIGGSEEQKAEEPKKKREKASRTRKAAAKKQEEPEVPVEETGKQQEPTSQEQEEAVKNITDSQEAPFPDVQTDLNSSMNVPEEMPPVTEQSENTGNSAFQMFDDDGEQPF